MMAHQEAQAMQEAHNLQCRLSLCDCYHCQDVFDKVTRMYMVVKVPYAELYASGMQRQNQ